MHTQLVCYATANATKANVIQKAALKRDIDSQKADIQYDYDSIANIKTKNLAVIDAYKEWSADYVNLVYASIEDYDLYQSLYEQYEDTRDNAVAQARETLVGELGTLQITRATTLGSAEVTYQTSCKSAEVTHAENIASANSAYTNALNSVRSNWISSTSNGQNSYQVALANAGKTYQQSLDSAESTFTSTYLYHATYMQSITDAQTDYLIAQATMESTTLNNALTSMSTDQEKYEAGYATAKVAWLSATQMAKINHAVNSLNATMLANSQLTVAKATKNASDWADYVSFITSKASANTTQANSKTTAQNNYQTALTNAANEKSISIATADGDRLIAIAEAEKARAIAYATQTDRYARLEAANPNSSFSDQRNNDFNKITSDFNIAKADANNQWRKVVAEAEAEATRTLIKSADAQTSAASEAEKQSENSIALFNATLDSQLSAHAETFAQTRSDKLESYGNLQATYDADWQDAVYDAGMMSSVTTPLINGTNNSPWVQSVVYKSTLKHDVWEDLRSTYIAQMAELYEAQTTFINAEAATEEVFSNAYSGIASTLETKINSEYDSLTSTLTSQLQDRFTQEASIIADGKSQFADFLRSEELGTYMSSEKSSYINNEITADLSANRRRMELSTRTAQKACETALTSASRNYQTSLGSAVIDSLTGSIGDTVDYLQAANAVNQAIWDEYADLMETAATPGLTNSNPFIVNEAAKTLAELARDDAQISAQLAYSNEQLDREQTVMQGQLTAQQTQSNAKNTANQTFLNSRQSAENAFANSQNFNDAVLGKVKRNGDTATKIDETSVDSTVLSDTIPTTTVRTISDMSQASGYTYLSNAIFSIISHANAVDSLADYWRDKVNTGSTDYNCFAAGTQVLMADGSLKNIEDIQVGDWVMSVPEDAPTAEPVAKQVTETFVRNLNRIVELTINGETIRTTEDHPFYVVGFGWSTAGSLHAGDTLLTDDGVSISLENIVVTDEFEKVYNFEVADNHTYFVMAGDEAVLVHNENLYDTALNAVITAENLYKELREMEANNASQKSLQDKYRQYLAAKRSASKLTSDYIDSLWMRWRASSLFEREAKLPMRLAEFEKGLSTEEVSNHMKSIQKDIATTQNDIEETDRALGNLETGMKYTSAACIAIGGGGLAVTVAMPAIASSALMGGTSSLAGYMFSSGYNGTDVTYADMFLNAGIGAASGALGTGLSSGLMKTVCGSRIGQMAVGSLTGGATDALTQGTEILLGLRSEYDYLQTLGAVTVDGISSVFAKACFVANTQIIVGKNDYYNTQVDKFSDIGWENCILAGVGVSLIGISTLVKYRKKQEDDLYQTHFDYVITPIYRQYILGRERSFERFDC